MGTYEKLKPTTLKPNIKPIGVKETNMGIKRETGERRKFSTGAEKQAAAGKGTPVLIPPDAILEVAKHFEEGAEVHGERNWEKGIPLSELMNSLERHTQQEKMGLTDERHDRAIAWIGIVYLATKMRIQQGILPKELDDLCGAYRKPKRDIKIGKCSRRMGENEWYIYDKLTGEYLRKDLKFYPSLGHDHFHPTKEAAEECIQKYLEKGGD